MKTITNLLFGIVLLCCSSLTYGQNDNFADAIPISCGNSYSGTTVGATLDEDNAPDGFGADMDAPNLWYSFTGSGSAEAVTLNLCNSAYDTSVLVYTGTSGNLTLVIANDDDNTCGAALTTRSRLTFNSDGATTYYIAVEGWNATSTGTFNMDVTCAAVNPPAVDNQTCASALNLEVDASVLTSDNSFGDVTATQPTCDLFGSVQDVWFSFVAPSSTVDVTVSRGTMASANFAVYSGTCDALASLACNANLAAPFTQSLTTLTAGNTYYVQVWSNGAEQGDFTISLSDPSICLPVATFEKVSNCPVDATFTVNVDITSLASASSVTVTDDQASAPQTVSSTGVITFGPYPGGTSVVLTVTNDQSPSCALVSNTITQGLACPQANDECVNAVALNCGDTLTNQTTEGASGGSDTSCVGTIGDDIWYTFVGDGQVNTLTATAVGASDGAQIEVYESTDGTCSGFTPGSCFAAVGSGELASSLVFISTIGTTYYIHIGNWINGDPAITFDLSLTCETPPTPPANDECDGAVALTVNSDASCAVVTSGTVNGATASAVDTAGCAGSEDDDVWYSFVATDTIQAVSLNNVAGSDTDLNFSVWSGDCGTLALVAGSCTDAAASTITGLTAGETYFIRVFTASATPLQNTTFDICVGTPPPPPANDDCSNAIELTAGGEFTTSPLVGTTVSATTTAGLPAFACQVNRVNDVWYTVMVPASGTLTVETAADAGTLMTDSVLSVFTGTCGSLTEIGCDDDSGTDNFSKVVLTGLTPGEMLYIGIWRYSLGIGVDGAFQVSAYDASLLSNDTFDTADFRAYPNPVKNVLNLSYSKNISTVAVYNLLGQEVMTRSSNSNLSQIDMSNLLSGTYLVKVTIDNQIKTIKVIKE